MLISKLNLNMNLGGAIKVTRKRYRLRKYPSKADQIDRYFAPKMEFNQIFYLAQKIIKIKIFL
jgi:hypothetical protein